MTYLNEELQNCILCVMSPLKIYNANFLIHIAHILSSRKCSGLWGTAGHHGTTAEVCGMLEDSHGRTVHIGNRVWSGWGPVALPPVCVAGSTKAALQLQLRWHRVSQCWWVLIHLVSMKISKLEVLMFLVECSSTTSETCNSMVSCMLLLAYGVLSASTFSNNILWVKPVN